MTDLVFQDGEPPRRSDRQYVVLAINVHGYGHNQPDERPRWMVVQWGNRFNRMKEPYWEWCVPGYSTRVEILKWAELPEMDSHGRVWASVAGEDAE